MLQGTAIANRRIKWTKSCEQKWLIHLLAIAIPSCSLVSIAVGDCDDGGVFVDEVNGMQGVADPRDLSLCCMNLDSL